jgi:hypothetical protein
VAEATNGVLVMVVEEETQRGVWGIRKGCRVVEL